MGKPLSCLTNSCEWCQPMNAEDRKKKKKQSKDKLNPLYKLTSFVHAHRIYTIFKHVPYFCVTGVAHFLAMIIFGRSKRLVRRMRESITHITGRHYPTKILRKLADANVKNMGALLFDVMLKGPNYDKSNFMKVVRFVGIEHLDAALKQGKGVLMPSLHVGDFFHCTAGLVLKGYDMVGVANMANRLVFEELQKMPQYKTLHVIGRENYDKIHDEMVSQLEQNHVLVLMHDLARKTNLKTRLVNGRRNVLVATPQSVVALNQETGAPIVPAVAIPDGTFTRSIITILDPAPIQAVIDEVAGKTSTEIHGRVSTVINEILFPYLLAYPHCHEELTGTGGSIIDVFIKLPAGICLADVLDTMSKQVEEIIKGSFEPGREDAALLAWLDEGWLHGKNVLGEKNEAVIMKKSIIKLGGLETAQQISKVLKICGSLCKKASFLDLAGYYEERATGVTRFFNLEN